MRGVRRGGQSREACLRLLRAHAGIAARKWRRDLSSSPGCSGDVCVALTPRHRYDEVGQWTGCRMRAVQPEALIFEVLFRGSEIDTSRRIARTVRTKHATSRLNSGTINRARLHAACWWSRAQIGNPISRTDVETATVVSVVSTNDLALSSTTEREFRGWCEMCNARKLRWG